MTNYVCNTSYCKGRNSNSHMGLHYMEKLGLREMPSATLGLVTSGG